MHLSVGGRFFPLRQIIIIKLQPNDLEYLKQRTDIHMNEMPDKKCCSVHCAARDAHNKFNPSVQLIKTSILEINLPFFFNLSRNLETSNLSKLSKSKGIIVKRLS